MVPEEKEKISDELADIFLYSILMANDLGIDIMEAADKKIDKNAKKYPIHKSKGKALKYTEFWTLYFVIWNLII